MVWPAVASGAAKVIGSAGLWTAASSAFKKAGPWLKKTGSKITGWIGSNKGASAGAGFLGGWGISDLTSRLGIEDSRVDLLVYGGLVLGALFAVGQLFEIQLGGN